MPARHARLLVLLGALALGLGALWPLPLYLTSAAPALPGDAAQDLYEKLWNIWWVTRALSSFQNPFQTDLLFFPSGASLLYHPLSVATILPGAPFAASGGLLLAYNLIVFASYPLAALACYALARHEGCGRLAACVGGVVYALCTFHIFHTRLSHLELVAIHWLPLLAIALDRALVGNNPLAAQHAARVGRTGWHGGVGRHGRVGRTGWHGGVGRTQHAASLQSLPFVVIAALVLLLLLFTSLYLAVYGGLLAALWVLWRLGGLAARGEIPSGARPIVLRTLLIMTLVLVVALPTLIVPMLAEAQRNPAVLPPPAAAEQRAAGALDVLLPPDYHPLRRIVALPAPQSAGAFLGYLPVLLAIIGIVRAPHGSGRWLVLAGGGYLLALGPVLPFYSALASLPLLQSGRYPDRFLILTQLALAVLAARGVASVARPALAGGRAVGSEGGSARVLTVFTLLALLAELHPGPTPLYTPPTHPVYAQLAAAPGAGSVVELPITRPNSAWLAMYAQTQHGRPILDGALARPVPRVVFRRLPMFRELEPAAEVSDIIVMPLAARQAALRAFGLGYLVYHRTDGENRVVPPDAAAVARITGAVATEVFSDDTLVAYRLAVPPGPAALPPVIVLGDGWYDREGAAAAPRRWITSAGADLRVDALDVGSYTLRLVLGAYNRPQRIAIERDDRQRIAEVDVQPGATEITVPLPLRAGQQRVRIVPLGTPVIPRSVDGSDDDRALTVVVFAVEIP